MITAETALHLANEANSFNGILEQINLVITNAAKGGYKSIGYSNYIFTSEPTLKYKAVDQLRSLGYDVDSEATVLHIFWSGV